MSDSQVYQLLGLVMVMLAFWWGVHRYMVARIDDGDSVLHKRIEKTTSTKVERHEFDRELTRLNGEMRQLNHDVIRIGEQQTAAIKNLNEHLTTLILEQNRRVDAVLLSIPKRKDDN